MNEIEKKISRMLISLSFDDESAHYIESLVALASQLDADLCGLFSEDSELQNIAKLPFSREITYPSALTRELNSINLARHLKLQAEKLRSRMEDISRLSNVTCSFKTIKGSRLDAVLYESFDFQVVVLFPEKYKPSISQKTARFDKIINPVIVLYNDSKQAKKAAHIIKSLADTGDLHQLNVLTTINELDKEKVKAFSFDNVKTEYHHIDSYKNPAIISILKSQKPGLLIFPIDDTMMKKNELIKTIHDELACPLLLVR